jgi:glycine dehydrogenase subunit 1
MPYLPHTPQDKEEMLRAIFPDGTGKIENLFDGIPEALKLSRPLRIPARKSETEIVADFERLAEKNARVDGRPSFLGAGMYHRFIPSAVDYLASRGEFNTAYTPYQPEVSQGTLQAIFEYQTLMCHLTGMEISNASMYEGATALVEAVFMAMAVDKRRRRVLVSEGVHPEYRRTLTTYVANLDIDVVTVPLSGGVTDVNRLREVLDQDTLAVAFQSPNFFGYIEDGSLLRESLDETGDHPPLLIAQVDPISLALLSPPGAYGADIATGDGQQLGNYVNYGGPSFGFFATRKEHVRKLPGRVVGETTDSEGTRGYVLTFQTREQHIRRERATSNICTNQGICSLRAAMYLTCLGEEGLREVAASSVRRAHHAFNELTRIAGVEAVANAPFFQEFPLRFPGPADRIYESLAQAGIGGGLPLGLYFPERENEMLFAFTEMTTVEDIDALVRELTSILARQDGSEVRNGVQNATAQ